MSLEGITSAKTIYNTGDQKVIGNTTPRYSFNINASASWKGFDVRVFFEGIAKRDSVVAPQPIENIKNGFFPFYIRKANIDIPVYAPEFESLTPKLQELFVRTFVEGYKNPEKRVQAQEWLEVLKPIIEKFERETVQCKNNHYYFKHLSYCPYCEVQQKILGAMKTIDGDKGDDTKLVETKDKSQKKHTVGCMICWWRCCCWES